MKNINIKQNYDLIWNTKIKLYKDIFWEKPWNEWFICKNCNNIFPKKFMWKCDCNNSLLEPFYKNNELKYDFLEIISKNWYKEIVAEILGDKVWFLWWWQTNLNDLNNEKLKLNKDNFELLNKNIFKINQDFNTNNFYYLAEIWVKNNYRWNDIAWKMYKENILKLKNDWVKNIIVRTTKKSDVPYKWFLNEWYKEVFSYLDEQDRVILIKDL